jgi:hypothetical protein
MKGRYEASARRFLTENTPTLVQTNGQNLGLFRLTGSPHWSQIDRKEGQETDVRGGESFVSRFS